jgi:hypothetical protein
LRVEYQREVGKLLDELARLRNAISQPDQVKLTMVAAWLTF